MKTIVTTEPARPSASEWRLPARFHGRLLYLARASWIAVAVSLVGAVTAGFIRAFGDPRLVDLATIRRMLEQTARAVV